MLRKHFNHAVNISRSTVVGNKTTFAVVATLVPCHIQPMSPVYQNGQWGRLQKEYLLLSGTEIRVGDKLTDQDGIAYEVLGAAHKAFRGKSHYQAHIRSK
jgi:hypothetical protein